MGKKIISSEIDELFNLYFESTVDLRPKFSENQLKILGDIMISIKEFETMVDTNIQQCAFSESNKLSGGTIFAMLDELSLRSKIQVIRNIIPENIDDSVMKKKVCNNLDKARQIRNDIVHSYYLQESEKDFYFTNINKDGGHKYSTDEIVELIEKFDKLTCLLSMVVDEIERFHIEKGNDEKTS